MGKLTIRTLQALKPDQHGKKISDGESLWGRVRVTATGISVSFYLRDASTGKARDISCGSWPATSLAKIRANCDEARRIAKQGLNPSVQKKIDRQKQREAEIERLAEIERQASDNLTLQQMFEAWIQDGVRRAGDNAELKRSFKADVLPKVGVKLVREISEADIRAVLKALVERGVNRAAVVMRNDLTQMFAWAEKRQPWRKLLANGNPMDLIEIDRIVPAGFDINRARDRILKDTEIQELQEIFAGMQQAYDSAPNKRVAVQPVERTTQLAVWIMLSTMCRVGEMSMAKWEDLDFETKEWRIPRENVKGNISELTIYLSEFVLDKFRQLHDITGESDWCFPARNKPGHICVKSISKQIGDRQSRFKQSPENGPRKPLAHRRSDDSLVLGSGKYGAWTPHDLRRTGATMMQTLAISPDIIDRCQNHMVGGSKVRRAYQHHDYRTEKQDAWERLGERLSLLLNPPANVKLLPQSA